jgi:hypothetical protein
MLAGVLCNVTEEKKRREGKKEFKQVTAGVKID